MLTDFDKKVYGTVRTIPRGKVTTYGDIARACGSPRACRAVGGSLHKNPFDGDVPCHRVVNSKGRLAPKFCFGGEDEQAQRLMLEGVEVKEATDEKGNTFLFVDLKTYGYIPY